MQVGAEVKAADDAKGAGEATKTEEPTKTDKEKFRRRLNLAKQLVKSFEKDPELMIEQGNTEEQLKAKVKELQEQIRIPIHRKCGHNSSIRS